MYTRRNHVGHVECPHFGRCRGQACMMWRWAAPPPKRPEPRCVFVEFDTPEALQRAVETEPPRPEECPPDFEWVSVELNPEYDDHDGGYWEESEDAVTRAHAEALDAREGYCGLAGKPEYR